ncbi:hypothetical protein DPMN_099697 [Dreissena polymorpha]|uniref:Uncharacterized protein n=1 Tax=Dreissena polymorpha TaxID=45954 RepID=A0A9D4R7H0_DREPO|nr:hypothetical protein DPMN_099697 [Dreissena polymorpha]
MDGASFESSNANKFEIGDYCCSYTRNQNGSIDDESTDEEPEDYAPDPREYYSHFYLESERLSTFHDWPHWANVTKEDSAKNGFMYLHVSDRVQCVFCRACLASFRPGDIVADEHRKYCPECPFAFGYECGNIPIPSSRIVQQPAQTVQELNTKKQGKNCAKITYNYTCVDIRFKHRSRRRYFSAKVCGLGRRTNKAAVLQRMACTSKTNSASIGSRWVFAHRKWRSL